MRVMLVMMPSSTMPGRRSARLLTRGLSRPDAAAARAEGFDALDDGATGHAAGAGLRWRLSSKDRMNLGLDVTSATSRGAWRGSRPDRSS